MTKKRWIVQTQGWPCDVCGGTEWVCECDHDKVVALLQKRITELEAAARAVVDAFPYTIDTRWKPACNCAECIAMRGLIALLSEEET